MICIVDNQCIITCKQAVLASKLFQNTKCTLRHKALLSKKKKKAFVYCVHCQTYHIY